jgi:hypothetical protein
MKKGAWCPYGSKENDRPVNGRYSMIGGRKDKAIRQR